ncbi:Uncharacterized protein TSPI_05935 [Trichinella spiralis]|uniref:Uncharacterized protein n=1 Tax=Trichinella spiralis TaxID=6334 RepID=A0ABR3KVL6_TRISP
MRIESEQHLKHLHLQHVDLILTQPYVIEYLERISSNFIFNNLTCHFSSSVHDKLRSHLACFHKDCQNNK